MQRPRDWRSSARLASATRSQRLQQLQSRQFVESATAGDIDVVAGAVEQRLVAVNVVMIRGGRHVGDRTFFPRGADAFTTAEAVPAFLEQHYVERPVPPTIVAPEAGDVEALAEVLSMQSSRKVDIVTNPGGERRVWLAMATQNASWRSGSISRRRRRRRSGSPRCRRALGLPPSAQRIECFDVSHTMGEARGRVVRHLRPARDAVFRVPALQRHAADGR